MRPLLTFYGNYALPSIVITLFCAYFFYEMGIALLTTITWFKLISLAAFVYYVNSYKSKEFYYYHNLGISKRFLWACTIGFDLFIYILSVTLAAHLQ